MVKYGSIIKAIDLYVTKCPTIAEIREKVNSKSPITLREQLEDRKLINEYELEHYKTVYERIKSFRFDEKFNKTDRSKDIQYCKDLLFKYQRRLFDGSKPREVEPLAIDESEYSMTEQTTWNDPTIGPLEWRQIWSQEDIIFTEDERNAIRHYLNSGYVGLNSKLNKGEQWEKLDDNEKKAKMKNLNKMDKDLSSAIAKSKGLLEPTVMFHGGFFDATKSIGDTVKFNGFTSCSYQKSVAVNYMNNKDKDYMGSCMYKILLPTGYKGLCGNAQYFTDKSDERDYHYVTAYRKEHEYLLPKNAKFKVVNVEEESIYMLNPNFKRKLVTLIPV